MMCCSLILCSPQPGPLTVRNKPAEGVQLYISVKMDYTSNFSCFFCDAVVPSAMADAMAHVDMHSKFCPICGSKLTTVEIENERHLRQIHRVGVQIPTPSTNHFHTCSICREAVPVFPRGSNLDEDNMIATRRHYLRHFDGTTLKPQYQEEYVCPYPTCFKAFNHRQAVYTCFFIHPNEDLPLTAADATTGRQAREIHSQVHSPPPATNMIGNPLLSSTQAGVPGTLDTASNGSEDHSQSHSVGSQDVAGPQERPSSQGLDATVASAVGNGTGPAAAEGPSLEETQAMLFYRLRCLHGVPEDGLTLISNTLKGIEARLQTKVNTLVGEELLHAAIPREAATCVSDRVKGRMEDEPLLFTPALSSKHLRKRYFNRHYPIIHPIFVRVPEVHRAPARFYVRFDIADLLNRFFRDRDVQNSFQLFNEAKTAFTSIANRATEDGMPEDIRIHSMTEGSRYRDKCGSRSGPIVPLVLYLDGFGTNDPAGSKGNLHKILGIYVGVAASPITYSERQSIFLLSLVRHEDVKAHGVHHFIEDVLNDIDMARNQPFRINGVEVGVDLLYVIGDNLESNGLAGLGGGFSRWVDYVCRHCEITSSEYSTVGGYREMKQKSTPRTHERYLLHQSVYLRTRDKAQSKGVVSRSALQDFRGMDLALDLPSCHIHNLFGGECRTLHIPDDCLININALSILSVDVYQLSFLCLFRLYMVIDGIFLSISVWIVPYTYVNTSGAYNTSIHILHSPPKRRGKEIHQHRPQGAP